MDSTGVPFENSHRQLVERIQQYLLEHDQRVIRRQRASMRWRIAGLRYHSTHRLVRMELDALQEIPEIARARLLRRLTERFNDVRVHHLSRGIRSQEHRQRVQEMVLRAVQFHQRAYLRRSVLYTDQQDHDQQGENVVHEQSARLQGDQDHRQERVDDIANEEMASSDGLQLQDTAGHHPVLPPDDDVKVADALPEVAYIETPFKSFKSWRRFA